MGECRVSYAAVGGLAITLPIPPPSMPQQTLLCQTNQTGGTLLVEEVLEPNGHGRRLLDPDDYRPCCCPNCRGSRLHAHIYRERRVEMGCGIYTEEQVRRYRWVACRAIWPVAPDFLERHLRGAWSSVQTALRGEGMARAGRSAARENVPSTTLRRWVGRLACSAQALIPPLACVCSDMYSATEPLPTDLSRGALAQALLSQGLLAGAYALTQITGWIHREMHSLRFL